MLELFTATLLQFATITGSPAPQQLYQPPVTINSSDGDDDSGGGGWTGDVRQGDTDAGGSTGDN